MMEAQRSQLNLCGVIVPMITPLTTGGEVDQAAIERLVTHLLASGVDGIFVLGSSGEGPWLTASQRQQVIGETARVAAGRAPILAGLLEPSTGRTIEALRMAEDAGADAVVVTSPYYFGVDAAAQICHVETICASCALPVVLYNIPQNTHNPLTPATIRQLLEIDNLVAIKDSTGNWQHFEELLELRASKPGLRVFQGDEKLAARALLAGADGVVPGLGNLAPRLFSQIVASTRAGDKEMALSLQERVNSLWELHTYGFWLACLKYAASLLEFGGGATCGGANTLADPAKAANRQLVQAYVGPVT